MTKPSAARIRHSGFVIRHSFVIRASSFDILLLSVLSLSLGAALLGMSPAQASTPPDGAPAAPIVGEVHPLPSAPGSAAGARAEVEAPTFKDNGPRERLAALGITAEHLAAHVDQQPLEKEPQTVELLSRLLLRLETLPPADFQRWGQTTEDFSQMSQAGRPELRGLFFAASGRVQRVQQVQLGPRDADRFQFERYYRCACLLGTSGTPAVVYTRHVPPSWLTADKLDERIGLVGLYLGRGAPAGEDDTLLMVVPRLAWHSDSLLGDLGLDIGLLEEVTDGGPITGEEAEIFYQLLVAAGRVGVSESLRHAKTELKQRGIELMALRRELTEREQALQGRVASSPKGSPEAAAAAVELRKITAVELRKITEELRRLKEKIVRVESGTSELLPMLAEPQRSRGRLVLVRCLARRILEVKVTDPEVRRRFGFDHYYQVDAIANLELTVRLNAPRRVEQGRVVTEVQDMWSHPVTFCVRRLPQGLSAGEKLHEEIIVPAFFFKNWSYDTLDLEGDKSGRRMAPLLIASEPIRELPPPSGTNSTAGLLAGALIAVVLIGIWIAVWRTNRAARRLKSAMLARHLAAGGAVALNQLDLSAVEVPNFRHLDEPLATAPRPEDSVIPADRVPDVAK